MYERIRDIIGIDRSEQKMQLVLSNCIFCYTYYFLQRLC